MAELPKEDASGVCFDAGPPPKKARAADDLSDDSEGTVTVKQYSQQEEGAGSQEGTAQLQLDGATAGSSDPEAAADGRREAYYSANFKAVLNSALDSSHERQAIGEDSLETVHRFLTLTGVVWLINSTHYIARNYY